MECKKCGKKVTKGTKFCTNCGEEVIFEEKKTTSTKTAKATTTKATKTTKTAAKATTAKKATIAKVKVETKKEEPKKEETVKTEPIKVEEPKKEVKKEGNGLAIAGMVLGIVGLIFSFFFGLVAFLLPLLGLIFSIVAKGKKGFKITGIITSIVAILIEIVVTVLSLLLVTSIFSFVTDYIGNSSKGEDPHGRWVCAPFSSSTGGYNTDVNSVDDEDKTILQLGEDGRYVYGTFLDTDDNHYAGYYMYDIEYDKNEENISNGYKFIEIDGDVDEYINKGIKGSTYNKTFDMEMELFRDYNYDKALIIFPSTYNMYICER